MYLILTFGLDPEHAITMDYNKRTPLHWQHTVKAVYAYYYKYRSCTHVLHILYEGRDTRVQFCCCHHNVSPLWDAELWLTCKLSWHASESVEISE